MRASILCVLWAVACGGAAASAPAPRAPAPAPFDVSAVRDSLVVFQDGKGHYVALVEPSWERESPEDQTLFWGDGKVFHAVPVRRASENGLEFEIEYSDPRISITPAGSVKRALGKTALICESTTVTLVRVPPAEAKAMLAGARFEKRWVDHAPLSLGQAGDRYLYVDSQRGKGGRTYRIFEGPKGKLALVDTVEGTWDERRNLLPLKTKDRTLIVSRAPEIRDEYTLKAQWEGKGDEYKTLPREANWHLIFEGLGIYGDRPGPTPCDLVLP